MCACVKTMPTPPPKKNSYSQSKGALCADIPKQTNAKTTNTNKQTAAHTHTRTHARSAHAKDTHSLVMALTRTVCCFMWRRCCSITCAISSIRLAFFVPCVHAQRRCVSLLLTHTHTHAHTYPLTLTPTHHSHTHTHTLSLSFHALAWGRMKQASPRRSRLRARPAPQ